MGWPTHSSPSNYVYNHIGMFATARRAAGAVAVPGRRAPALPDAALRVPGGRRRAGRRALYADLVGHWEKRNRDAIDHYDPAHLDRAAAHRAVRASTGRRATASASTSSTTGSAHAEPSRRGPGDARRVRARAGSRASTTSATSSPAAFHFGCEADDPMTALAFDARRNPLGARLKAMFASDIGHWDVPDIREVLPEAWELVDDGHVTEADFRALTFENPVSLWASTQSRVLRGHERRGRRRHRAQRVGLEGLEEDLTPPVRSRRSGGAEGVTCWRTGCRSSWVRLRRSRPPTTRGRRVPQKTPMPTTL